MSQEKARAQVAEAEIQVPGQKCGRGGGGGAVEGLGFRV